MIGQTSKTALALLVTQMVACKGEQTCEEASPQIELQVSAAALTSIVTSLNVRMGVDGSERQRQFALEGELEDGITSLAIDLASEPEENFVVSVHIDALSATGAVLATAEETFLGKPNACNRFPVFLRAPTMADAGPINTADTGVPDMGVPVGVDMGVPQACASQPDDSTVALYPFESNSTSMIFDVTGLHPGQLFSQNASAIRTNGPNECGGGLTFRQNTYAQVQNAVPFQLDEGSLDFWVRFDEADMGEAQGIISRDATGRATPGHITVFRSCENRLIVRLQNADGDAHRCSIAPLTLGAWTHVGINFGAPNMELFIDGAPAVGAGEQGLFGPGCEAPVECDTPTESGIAGNENPWLFGASGGNSVEGMQVIPSGLFSGALDSVRISRNRRQF